VSRCTGHCCARFYLSTEVLDVLTSPERRGIDGKFILDMVELIEFTEAGATCTCRHFDGKNCTVYDQRPQMCRDYPYGKPCTIEGCTRKES